MARHRANPDVHQLNYFAKSAIFTGCPRGNFLSVVIVCFNLSLRLAHSLIILFFPWLDGVRSGIPGGCTRSANTRTSRMLLKTSSTKRPGLLGVSGLRLRQRASHKTGTLETAFTPTSSVHICIYRSGSHKISWVCVSACICCSCCSKRG
jgi:hypothetical protein